MEKKSFLSIVIPLFNEEERLYNLDEIIAFTKTQNFPCELILVNDGSKDQTLEKLQNYKKENDFVLISYSQNQGKGHAIKKGMLEATGKYCLFTDIDLSTPLAEFNKFTPHLANYDLVIGSRKIKGAKVTKHQPKLRESLGKVFTALSNIILGTKFSDFTCGFKCFSQKAAQEIFSRSVISGWGFDTEILFIAHKKNYDIKEIPVEWENDPKTKVKFPRDIINSFSELIKIRINNFQKKYE